MLRKNALSTNFCGTLDNLLPKGKLPRDTDPFIKSVVDLGTGDVVDLEQYLKSNAKKKSPSNKASHPKRFR